MRERSRALWTRLGQLDPRYLVSFLITLVLVLGEARYGILGGYDRLAIALGVCVATEIGLARLVGGRTAAVQSAYVTGISLALLLKPQTGVLWPFALGAFLAIARNAPRAKGHNTPVCGLRSSARLMPVTYALCTAAVRPPTSRARPISVATHTPSAMARRS